jgi:hypothetical protein
LASSERIIGKSSRLLNCKDCRPSTHVLSAVPGFSEDKLWRNSFPHAMCRIHCHPVLGKARHRTENVSGRPAIFTVQ